MEKEHIIVGNWKMYKTEQETVEFLQTLAPLVAAVNARVYLAVPFTSIPTAVKVTEKTNIVIGAQNMNDATKGAFTGEIAGIMLKASGAEFVILGHSERRELFKEDDDFINRKVIRALKDDLQPILCIGETLDERELGKTEEVLARQLQKGLKKVSMEDVEKIIIAYEPVWAIGTGKTATPELAQEAHRFIRQTLGTLFSGKESKISLLYGGSVKPDNAALLLSQKDINGALVGGASLDPKSFADIINAC
ncbi:MAG: triose-phosphate isomerase [Parachlamydiales bacterium]|nr:triose-phosphate isomerase [Parachlamydiales bacterium]